MKRILLIADLEGIIGVVDIFSDENKKYLSEEIGFIVNVLKKNKVQKIDICYIHDGGRLLKNENLFDNICRIYHHISQIDFGEKYDGVFMVGFHAKNNSGGYFDHTIREDIEEIIYGDLSVGEIELYGRWIEKQGIPVLLVAGEDIAEKEAENIDSYFFSTKSIRKKYKKEELLKEYEKKISESINSKKVIEDFTGGKIEIKYINNDILEYMKRRGYKVENNRLVFNSLNEFILNDIFWEEDMMNAYNKLLSRNIQFSLYLKKHKEKILDKENLILRKKLDLISKRDIEYIINNLLCHE